MTRRPVLRLILWYMAILMALSLTFSAAVYEVTRWDLNRELYYQSVVLHHSGASAGQPWLTAARSAANLHRNLIMLAWLNLGIMVVGSLVCYRLARRTLRPIDSALALLQRFTADASHRLRTPLSAMMLQTEVALEKSKLPENEVRRLLESNLEEMGKLNALTGDMLTLARYESQTSPQSLTPLELPDLIAAAAGTVEPLANARNVRIVSEVKALTVEGDQTSLTEALTILLDNAVKYATEHSEVLVTGARSAHRASVTISNHGAGIAPDDLPHVFERFWRADNVRAASGTGLGLAIARQIVELHRGAISVASTPGQTTSFAISLPIAKSV